MNSILKKSLLANKILKIVSLILAFATWSLLSQYQIMSTWIEIPICFYNVAPTMKVIANQEKISIQVQGKAADICQCHNLALHVDAGNFKPGQQRICPCAEQLFLPNSVKLVHNKPLYIEITSELI